MISGPLQGRLLTMLCHLIQPKTILELGTFTGYATLCMAEGLASGGTIISIDHNEEILHQAQKNINKSKYKANIELHHGDGKTIIPSLNHSFDFVFIDASKRDYSIYYDLIIDKLRRGGLILADNILWSEKVIAKKRDSLTMELDAFNKKVVNDDRVENFILPFRDGINMIRKK
jgi:caffeoyl-CoA O-methyltransferase